MDTVSKVLDESTLKDAQAKNANRIVKLPADSQLALAAAQSMVGKNYTPDQKKAAAQQYILSQADKMAANNPSLNRDDIVAKATAKFNARVDKSVVQPEVKAADGVYQTKTIQAPNGKEYDMRINTKTGQAEFVANDGTRQKYQSEAAAVNKINISNPEGSVAGAKNQIGAQNQFVEGAKIGADGNPVIDNQTAQTILDVNADTKDDNLKAAKEQEAAQQAALNQLIEQSDNLGDDQKAIINERMQNVYNTFDNINGILADLKTKSEHLFDEKATRSADARAKQLADKGYLLDDQAAAVSQYSLADYKRDIEIQRSEIDKQISEKMIEIEQEKAKQIDTIQKDASLNEKQKLDQINYLNGLFNNIKEQITNKQISINDAFNQNTANVLGVTYQADVQASAVQKTSAAENAALQDEKRRAATSDTARTAYISKIITQQNPEAAAYVSSVIGDLIDKTDTAWYLRQNIDSLVGRVSSLAMAKAQQEKMKLIAAQKAK